MTVLKQLRQMAEGIDSTHAWWRFPEEDSVRGFLGTSRVFFVGDQPSTSSWTLNNPGRRAFYDSLREVGLENAHLTDLYKRRGLSGELEQGLPLDFDEHVEFLRRELDILRPTRIIAVGRLAESLLAEHLPEVRSRLAWTWHFSYVVRAQRVDEYPNHLRRAVGLPMVDTASPADRRADSQLAAAPLIETPKLATKVASVPRGVRPRRWTLRRDNNAHHHGVVDISNSPLYLDLLWRENKAAPANPVGLYRLDLPSLLEAGCIRPERAGTRGPKLRLRIVLKAGHRFFVQVREGSPFARLAE